MTKIHISLLIAILLSLFGISHANQKNDQKHDAPDGKYTAYVIALPKAPYGSGESNIVIKAINGKILFTKNYGSETGEHGFGVDRAAWTPDSRFFVYSMSSSGGHQAWHTPTYFISISDFKERSLDDHIGPITDSDFELKDPDIIITVGRAKETLEETSIVVSLTELLSKEKIE